METIKVRTATRMPPVGTEKNTGHLQTRCFKRIADRKPLVTKNNKVFLFNGADVIPERGMTSEEISACKDAKIQGYCKDQDFQ
jgi:hypothetical protein